MGPGFLLSLSRSLLRNSLFWGGFLHCLFLGGCGVGSELSSDDRWRCSPTGICNGCDLGGFYFAYSSSSLASVNTLSESMLLTCLVSIGVSGFSQIGVSDDSTSLSEYINVLPCSREIFLVFLKQKDVPFFFKLLFLNYFISISNKSPTIYIHV